VREYVDISRSNLSIETIDLLQLHVWQDDWLASGELQQTVAELKREVPFEPSESASTTGALERRPGVRSVLSTQSSHLHISTRRRRTSCSQRATRTGSRSSPCPVR